MVGKSRTLLRLGSWANAPNIDVQLKTLREELDMAEHRRTSTRQVENHETQRTPLKMMDFFPVFQKGIALFLKGGKNSGESFEEKL